MVAGRVGNFMAIFGKLEDLRLQFEYINELRSVFDYLNNASLIGSRINTRIISMNCDQYKKIEITKNIFAIEQSYATKASGDLSLFESHLEYVDFQFLVSGEEIIKTSHTDLLEVNMNYNEENDYSLYNDNSNASEIVMQKDFLAIFFPKDGHMPGVLISKSNIVSKTVVKVPVQILF